MDTSNDSEQLTITFLRNAATLLPQNKRVSNLLQSYYLNRSRDLAAKTCIILPKKIYGENSMCQKCSLPWGAGQFTLSIQKKMLRNSKENSPKNSKTADQFMITTCKFCEKRQKVKLDLGARRKKDKKTAAIESAIKSTKIDSKSLKVPEPVKQLPKKLTLLTLSSRSKKMKKKQQLPNVSKKHPIGAKKLPPPPSSAKSKNKNDLLKLAQLLSKSSAPKPTGGLQKMFK